MTFMSEEGVNKAISFDKLVESDSMFAGLNVWLGKYHIDI